MLPSDDSSEKAQLPAKKGARLWLILASMCICLFLSALELTSVSSALPTITNVLHTTHFIWAGSAYALASTAFLPMSGGLAQTFGRRPAILVTIGLFMLGSGVCGSANNMNMFIAGRFIQGLGGGGIQSLTGIILADLIPLQERGVYTGLFTITWCLAIAVGPVVGGSLATHALWRWLFYLNIPLSLVVCVLVVLLLDLPIPSGSTWDKLARMDWTGNLLVISSTTLFTIGLTWGGITAPWGSATVLVPLVVGLVGLGTFILYEVLAKNPLVPPSLLTNITTISGYMQTFFSYIVSSTIIYYFPVYFQACKGASPILSGTYLLAFASLGPAGVVTGILIKTTGRYRPQMWLAWAINVIGLGLMSTIRATDPVVKPIGCAAILGCGLGMVMAASTYPILAPLPVTLNAPAIAFMWFLRSLASVFGFTIAGAIFQNRLAKQLPASFIQFVPEGTAIIYALIPELPMLQPHIRYEVQAAFASSLATLWRFSAIVSAAGLVASLLMRPVPLQKFLDSKATSCATLTNEDADQMI